MTRRVGGFTLVEVMFALAIFALGALAALMVATQQLDSTRYLQERYMGQLVASNRLAELHDTGRDGAWPPRDGAKGEMEFAGSTWYWEQQVLETVTADLREVTVRVRVTESGAVVAELSSFVGRR